ncbi:MAG: ATP-binding cassette domain-containing protein, partial [Coprobacillus sp.]
KINLSIEKEDAKPTDVILNVNNLIVEKAGHKNAINNISFDVKKGEIVCIAGIDGNGQTELVHALTGLSHISSGSVALNGQDITNKNIRYRNTHGLSHIPEDRHKHGLVLDYPLSYNLVLQRYFEPEFSNKGFLKFAEIDKYSTDLIEQFDVRSGQGSKTIARSMSGGNQQKAIVAREMAREHDCLIAVQPTRGLDVGAIEYIHKKIVEERDNGTAILLISLELDEVMNLSDRILVIYEGEIVGELDPKETTFNELGLYMSGSKRGEQA